MEEWQKIIAISRSIAVLEDSGGAILQWHRILALQNAYD